MLRSGTWIDKKVYLVAKERKGEIIHNQVSNFLTDK
jgi:hypothetical protein